MASSEYGGGVGGKFRTRPFRRALATPYDRPQTSVRTTNPNPNHNIRKNGWLSRIIDPASRVVAWSASRLFSSAFQKRLTDSLPEHPDENLLCRNENPGTVSNDLQLQEPSNAGLEQGGNGGDNVPHNHDTEGIQEGPFCTDGIFELEQLMKQNIFSKADSARLKDLLLSRTVESGRSQPTVDFQTQEVAIASEPVKDKEQSTIDTSTSHQAFRCELKVNAIALDQEDGKQPIRLRGHVENPAASMHISDDETGSPEEIAKAYIGSRPSRVSRGLSVKSQIFQEDLSSPAVQHAHGPSTSLLAHRSSVHLSDSEKGFLTPRAHGRSALYKISRSPYFGAHSITNATRPPRDGIAGPSTSLGTMISIGKQVKRQSSVFDSDFGSFGPLRRTRQKSNMTSPIKGYLSSPGNVPPAHTSPSRQGNEEGSNCFTNVTSLSTELARKILGELDKLVPSPRVKLHEKKDVEGTGNLDTSRESLLTSLRSSTSLKEGRIMEEVPLNTVSGLKVHQQPVWDVGVTINRKTSDATISGSAGILSIKEPVCETNIAEASREMNAGKYFLGTASGQPITANVSLLDKSLASSSKNTAAKSFDRSPNETGVDLKCPAAPASSSEPSAVSIIPPLVDIRVPKNRMSAPVSKLGFQGSSITAAIHKPANLRFGASNTSMECSLEVSGSDEGSKLEALPTSITTGFFTFGASNGSNGNHGSLSSSPSSATVSACPGASYSSDTRSPTVASTVAFTPGFPTAATFQFGSGTSSSALNSVSAPSFDKPLNTGDLEEQPSKASPLTTSSSIASAALNLFSNPSMTGAAQTTSSIFSALSSSSASAASCSLPNSASGFSPLLTSSPKNGIVVHSASTQFNSTSSLFAKNSSSSPFGQTGSQSANWTMSAPQSSAVQTSSLTSSPAFPLIASSSLGSGSSLFSPVTSASKAFGFHSGFSSSSAVVGSFSASVPSVAPTAGTSFFSSSSQLSSSSSAVVPTFGSSSPLPSPDISFGLSASITSGTTTSSGPVFSFSAATVPASPSPSTPMPVNNVGFGNDGMSVEDGMDAGSIQTDAAAATAVPRFGQAAQSTPSLGFGTPAPVFGGQPVFQFGSTQNSAVPQSAAVSQAASSFDFSSEGSFSLGSSGGGGADKSGRRFIKVRRDKHRRK